MKKTLILCALAALYATACGPTGNQTETNPAPVDSSSQVLEGSNEQFCGQLSQVLDDLRAKRGTCTPNYMNEEPFAFNLATCEASFSTECSSGEHQEVAAYIQCLDAIGSCDPAAQGTFDEQIDSCLDHAQQVLSESCIEVVIGD